MIVCADIVALEMKNCVPRRARGSKESAQHQDRDLRWRRGISGDLGVGNQNSSLLVFVRS